MATAMAVFLALTGLGAALLWPSSAPREPSSSLRDLAGGSSELVDATIERAGRGPCPDLVGQGTTVSTCDLLDVVLDGRTGPAARVHLDTLVDPTAPRYEAGEEVRLAPTTDVSGRPSYYIADFQRAAPLGWIALLTAAVVVAVARWRGLAALAGLVLSYLVIVKFTLPSLLDGHSPVGVALTTGAALLVGLLYLAHGVSARTTAALLGTLASLVLTAALGAVAIDLARVTGLGSDEDVMLKAFAGELSLPGLVLASLIIGSLGLINDMTVTQAAAVWEVSDATPDASVRYLYRSVMRVGRDHIASSVYTLILAYAGAALPSLLLFTLADRSSADVATTDLVAAEIVRAAAGTVGLVASVPLTTAIAALAASRRQHTGAEPATDATDTTEATEATEMTRTLGASRAAAASVPDSGIGIGGIGSGGSGSGSGRGRGRGTGGATDGGGAPTDAETEPLTWPVTPGHRRAAAVAHRHAHRAGDVYDPREPFAGR